MRASNIFTYFSWAVPFACFATGYTLLGLLCSTNTLQTPNITGKTLQNACTILSQHKLAPHILVQKEEPDLPNGTVLSQTPSPQTAIKPNQLVYITLSKQPEKTCMPQFIGSSLQSITNNCSESAIRVKTHLQNSTHPHNTCIAQYPASGNKIEQQPITLYIAKNSRKSVIWPNFKGKTVGAATEFLAQYQITPEISPAYNKSYIALITDQRPLAGSIVALDSDIRVQIQT